MGEDDEIRGMVAALEAELPGQKSLFPGLAENQARRELAERRGPGRPPGAENRRTVETRELTLRLAAEHGITPMEYLWRLMLSPGVDEDRRDRAAVALLPYTAAKMPVAVDVTRRSFSVSIEMDGGEIEAGEGGDFVIEGNAGGSDT